MHVLRLDDSKDPARILAQAPSVSGSYVTVGVFDGVHRGHQRLITDMAKSAHTTGNAAVVLTFDPHPATVLGYDPPPALTTVEERTRLLAELTLDLLVVLPFTTSLAHTSAQDFVQLLDRFFHLVELWGGPDIAFGHRREGDIPFLRRLGVESGFAVRIVEPVVWQGEVVNSSRVRAALRAGDIAEATGCLGRPYRLAGTVLVSQQGIGEGHGATVQLAIPPDRLAPARGAYAGTAQVDGVGTCQALVSIGEAMAPGAPLPGKQAEGTPVTVEVRLLDCDVGSDDLANRELTLDFTARLQDGAYSPRISKE